MGSQEHVGAAERLLTAKKTTYRNRTGDTKRVERQVVLLGTDT